ncbi:MAG TPA: transposase [Stellaceae bacterium]|nr:transposase [Stellaceae bacterium]
MLRLPSRFATLILSFAPLFGYRSWRHAEVLLIGAILAPGQRTVSTILRIVGLAHERRFVNYHRVLNRAVWNPRLAARRLLGLAGDCPPDRPGLAGPGRHDRAPPWQTDRGEGDLSRSGALVEGTLRQGERIALDQPDGVGPDPLGGGSGHCRS